MRKVTIETRLFAVARAGDVEALATLLDQHPGKLHVGEKPYGHTLLHAAARAGQLAAVDLLLRRGLDPNVREHGDDTCAMHWAAAHGHLDIVRRLADAGGDVVGQGDDHQLEVIGWATCWEGCDDGAHRAVVDFLLSRGARHHIFSAIALGLGDEVRRIVAGDPGALSRRMSRNENHQLPLQLAVRMNRPDMVQLLLELGADPLGEDGAGMPVAAYARTPGADRPVNEAIRALLAGELRSARRGRRPARTRPLDLVALLALGDRDHARRLVCDHPALLEPAGGVLHLMARRGDAAAVRWLLRHGADPNGLWAHWDADVTPLHLAVLGGHAAVTRLLKGAGADPHIRDSKHDSDPIGWADFFGRTELVEILA